MNIEQERAHAQKLCKDSSIAVLPYGNAWWLLGNGINQVVGELAGLSPASLGRFGVTQR
jgi:hypothetical protein